MKTHLFSLSVLLLGFVLGWHSHVYFSVSPESSPPEKMFDRTFNDLENTGDSLVDFKPMLNVDEAIGRSPSLENTTVDEELDLSENFLRLLHVRRYRDAVELYVTVFNNDNTLGHSLKERLLQHLESLMELSDGQDFTELTDIYLTAFYDDIDVLLLLAKFNKQTDYFIEAVGVYHLAREYAYSIKSREKVDVEFASFLAEVDAYLTSKNDWYTLSQVYLQADIVELLVPKQKFRQANVYIHNGDTFQGKEILEALLNDSRFTERARELLASLNEGGSDEINENVEPPYASAVSLEKQGNQYLINLSLGRHASTRLLIDTGASVTTLSQTAFDNIQSDINAVELGVRMFSTANGVTKGRIFRIDEMFLGEVKIQDAIIAVLDFEMNGNVQGLLGMNVLGEFRFQINQDEKKLFLSPRQ